MDGRLFFWMMRIDTGFSMCLSEFAHDFNWVSCLLFDERVTIGKKQDLTHHLQYCPPAKNVKLVIFTQLLELVN
jgi:hypothetical protein